LPIASFETLVFLDFFFKKKIDEKIISVNLKMENVIFKIQDANYKDVRNRRRWGNIYIYIYKR